MAFLSREDPIRLGCRDGKGSCDGGELSLLDEGRVGDVTDVDAILVVANRILQTFSPRDLNKRRETLRLTLAPKQYPTEPIFLNPWALRVLIPETTTGSMCSMV